MKKTKKLFALALSIMMTVCMLTSVPITSFANTFEKFQYEITSETTAKITAYNGSDEELKIPQYVDNYEVTEIGENAFESCSNIISVVIPESVTTIGKYAFSNCSELIQIDMPNSVVSIGAYCFDYCSSLEKITIPDSVIYIGQYCFEECESLKSITISGSVTSIKPFCFRNCTSLEEVNILEGVTSIGTYCFTGCTSLTSVSIPNGVGTITSHTFNNCTNLTSITIPSSVDTIESDILKGCDALEVVNYNDSEYRWNKISIAENNEKLQNTQITYNTEVLIYDDFEYELNSDETVTIIAYFGTDETVCVPETIDEYEVTAINNVAFNKCDAITSVILPNSITSIGDYAFGNCLNLKSINLSENITSIGKCAFYNCSSLKSITLPDGITTIGPSTFKNCENLTSITIPDSVTSIDGSAFWNCKSLTSIAIPNSVTTIGVSSFRKCEKLESITMTESVTSIGTYAFYGCESLNNIYYTGNKEEWSKISISSSGNNEFKQANISYNACLKPNYVLTDTVKPTCTAKGYTVYTCSECGDTYKDNYVAALGHSYNDEKVTTATLTENGKIVTTCSVCGDVESTTTIYYPKTISLSTSSYTYNGNVRKPIVTVKDSNGNTISSSNYTVTYDSGRKNVGKYSVKITFKGNYSGTKTLYFTIKPKATSISKLTAKSKGFTVKWNKQATQTTGYQIQYSTSSSFKNAKTVTVSKNSTTSKTISSLTKNKKYYVRVRTYKTVNNTKYYSAWSSAKSVKTK